MRWDELFADLSGQFDALDDADLTAELADGLRHEFGRVTMLERLSGAVGGPIRILLPGGRLVTGQLRQLGPDWLLIRESPSSELLIALAAVVAIEGLSRRTGGQLGDVDRRFDLRKAVRTVARDRSAVTVSAATDVELTGTIDRVGADFLELAAHPTGDFRRRGVVRSVQLVPLSAVQMIRTCALA